MCTYIARTLRLHVRMCVRACLLACVLACLCACACAGAGAGAGAKAWSGRGGEVQPVFKEALRLYVRMGGAGGRVWVRYIRIHTFIHTYTLLIHTFIHTSIHPFIHMRLLETLFLQSGDSRHLHQSLSAEKAAITNPCNSRQCDQ